MAFQPSDKLTSRTFVGLILAQFLAAFNDQAIHIVAIFYAGDVLVHRLAVPHVDDKTVISVVTACFIAPFFFFSTLAGMLADRFGKRNILLFWKLAEVGMMALALAGFLLPHLDAPAWAGPRTLLAASAGLVVAVVFLMGTHSAFFIPAKYGIMPEILQPTALSRGNGVLEATSFLAALAGTAGGGFLYGLLKSAPEAGPVGREWWIGALLLGLAVVGVVGTLLMARVPAAAPDKPLTWKLWRPLAVNVSVLVRSRPLALSVFGIAFFAFMTLFLRQSLLYDGEVGKELHQARRAWEADVKKRAAPPDDEEGEGDVLEQATAPLPADQRAELKVALLIALVGLGVGIGSPLAGYLSGNKVELGLVPLGAGFLIVFTGLLAFLRWAAEADRGLQLWSMVTCLVLIGVAASFYIVPLYTLLQHRAPKDSKGNLVATSNFINVAGGLLAVAVFYALTITLERVLGLQLTAEAVQRDPGRLLPAYVGELEIRQHLPAALFLAASLFTAAMLVLLCRQLPDFIVRTVLWLRTHGRYRLRVLGLNNLPSDGPALLATNCDRFQACMQVLAATDRYTRFVLLESAADDEPRPLLRFLARRTGLLALRAGGTAADRSKALAAAVQTLRAGDLVALTVASDELAGPADQILAEIRAGVPVPILPVYCGPADPAADGPAAAVRRVRVVIGRPLPADEPTAALRGAIAALAQPDPPDPTAPVPA